MDFDKDAEFALDDSSISHTCWDSSDSEVDERFSSTMHAEFGGDDPLGHLEWATKLPHPWQHVVSPLSAEQVSALHTMVQDPRGAYQRLVETLQYWTRRKEEMAPANASYRATLAPHQQRIVGRLDLFLLEAMLTEAEHADESFVVDLSRGFPVTGNLHDGS